MNIEEKTFEEILKQLKVLDQIYGQTLNAPISVKEKLLVKSSKKNTVKLLEQLENIYKEQKL